jgi:hypothetical protein
MAWPAERSGDAATGHAHAHQQREPERDELRNQLFDRQSRNVPLDSDHSASMGC